MRFDNKVVVITGAGNGMGEAAARRFSAEGAIVVLADWAKEAVDKVAASLPKGRAMAVHIDVSDHVAVEKMMNEVAEKLGRIDVLLNNAGVHVAGSRRGRAARSSAYRRRSGTGRSGGRSGA